MFKLIFIALFLSQSILANEKLLYVLGGGGDPAGNTTIFDNDLKNMAKFVKKSDWKTTISFDGGHAETEKIIRENFGNSKNGGDFVKANYEAILKDITTKLESGELKSGDQLMLLLDSHGAQNSGDKTHDVALARNAATNLNNLAGARTVSLDTLQPIIDLAKAKGVKLAFVDYSCHSGNSLNLNAPDACVISSTGSKHYGYSGTVGFLGMSFALTFGGKFTKELGKGKNLEEAFLKARADGDAPDFPMISSKEGRAVQDTLYKLITPYLYYNDNQSTKFDDMYSVKNIDDKICSMENQYKELMRIISDVEKMQNISMNSRDFDELRKSLSDYRDYQRGYEKTYTDLKDVSSKIKEMIATDFPDDRKKFEKEDGLSIINTNYDRSLKFYQELYDKANTEFSKKTWKSALEELQRKKEIVENIKAKITPEMKDKIEAQKKMFEKSGNTYRMANTVANNLRKLYAEMYKANLNSDSNPCRDFVL